MPYITIKQAPAYHQITFEELIAGVIKMPSAISNNESNTRTYFAFNLKPNFLEKFDFDKMIAGLEKFAKDNAGLYKYKRSDLYDTFYIPKSSGGLREINAPKPELMNALRNLKTFLETEMYASYHTSAFAYITGRCTIDAVKRHQRNDSHWFLKIDFSNFFGNTSPKFLTTMLSQIFPFSEILKSERGAKALGKALDLCFLNGGLPQGTPISPMLTNLMMIPIDHALSNQLRDHKGKTYVYTRYADDILISSRRHFNYEELIEFIKGVLNAYGAPFEIKPEKTRYGSRAGGNWNLGVMLNKDNEITVGFKNKKRLKAMYQNFINDNRKGVSWELHDIQVLQGLTNYYHMVEADYIDALIKYVNERNNVDIVKMIKTSLSVG